MRRSISEENYIKMIFHLQQEGKVNTTLLATAVQTKPASVTDMLKKLQTKKIVYYQPYYGFELTESGKRIALDIIRKHRLWEFFLVHKLGFDWQRVHDVAEDLEHINNAELVTRLDNYLGNPQFDPHGDPIPNQNGKIKTRKQVALEIMPLNKSGIVSSIKNQSKAMLELLNHFNISIGTKIKVHRRFDFDNSAEIKIDRSPLTIVSAQVAKNVLCVI